MWVHCTLKQNERLSWMQRELLYNLDLILSCIQAPALVTQKYFYPTLPPGNKMPRKQQLIGLEELLWGVRKRRELLKCTGGMICRGDIYAWFKDSPQPENGRKYMLGRIEQLNNRGQTEQEENCSFTLLQMIV